MRITQLNSRDRRVHLQCLSNLLGTFVFDPAAIQGSHIFCSTRTHTQTFRALLTAHVEAGDGRILIQPLCDGVCTGNTDPVATLSDRCLTHSGSLMPFDMMNRLNSVMVEFFSNISAIYPTDESSILLPSRDQSPEHRQRTACNRIDAQIDFCDCGINTQRLCDYFHPKAASHDACQQLSTLPEICCLLSLSCCFDMGDSRAVNRSHEAIDILDFIKFIVSG